MTQTLVPARGTAPAHRRAAGTELLGEFQDLAYEQPRYLVQRADGQVMQLPELLYTVLATLDGQPSAEVAARVTAALSRPLSAEDVDFLVEERLRPVGVVDPGEADAAGADDAAAPPVRPDHLLALRHRVGVVPAAVAWRIAGFFRPLFARPSWPVLLAAFVAVDVLVARRGDLVGRGVAGVQQVVAAPALVLAGLALTVLAGAFHECGHVTACRYGGARPGDVGVGLYLVWPSFYSTVTDSYRLDRTGRLRTDLGGVYFDAVFMTGVGLVYLQTGQPWLLLALLGMHLETAWQFLPSVRLDGYYVLADLIGVPDLFGVVKPLVQGLRSGRRPAAVLAHVRPRARRALLAWLALAVPTLALGAVALALSAPRLLGSLGPAVGAQVAGAVAAVRGGAVAAACVDVLGLGLLLLPVAGLVLTLGAVARALAGAAARATHPAVRRAVGVVVPAALGAVLTWRVAVTAGPGRGSTRWVLLGRPLAIAVPGVVVPTAATAVLVACYLVAARSRGLPLPAAGLPLLAALLLPPAVGALATGGQTVAGAATVAVGAVLVARSRRPAAAVPAALLGAAGLVLAPLAALPLGAGALVLLGRRSNGRHATPGRRAPAGWPAVVAVGLAVAALGTALALHAPPPGAAAALLVACAVPVVAGALARGRRTPAG